MRTIGLLGCGNIASIIGREMVPLDCAACYDIDSERTRSLAGRVGGRPCASFDELIDQPFDLLVEAASIDALRDHCEQILRSGKDVLALSAGAFLDDEFRHRVIDLASSLGRHIQISSGALFGLDNLRVGQFSAVDQLTLRTTKSPRALGVQVSSRTCLFRGDAREAVQRFPKNMNVAASLCLAAGMEVNVELWADPQVARNTHEVLIRGRFGEAGISIANNPSPDNPGTSYLAALSIMAALRDQDEVFAVGN